jgi:hypothetical protein
MASTKPTSMTLTYVNLGAADPVALANFYAQLFGWRLEPEGSQFVLVNDPAGGVGVACQYEHDYVRPTWPAGRPRRSADAAASGDPC